MTTPTDSPVRPFGHFRLTAFFVLLTLGSGALGSWLVRGTDATIERDEAIRAVWITAVACGGVGFAAVFFHRMRINPVRWRETEAYLVAIRRESTKYRALMEGAADLLLVVEPRTRHVREASTRARAEFGLREGVTASAVAFVHPDDRARFVEALSRASERGAGPSPETSGVEELRFTTAAGATRVADARLAAVDVDGERLVQVSLRDVTQEKEMERSLRVHERLSSIGLLTAGVAHEINNPLEGIGNYLKLLEKPDLDVDTRRRYLDLVRHGFGRIGEIVRDLLRFARPDPGSGTADLSGVVVRAVKLSEYSQKLRGVAIETKGLDATLVVQGDSGRLEQVVVNLLLNAGAAMQGRGRVTITAARSHEGPPHVELTVEDEGPGIPEADLARIFDPFFSRSEGSGLGLSICYGIVTAHGGRIWAENRRDGGARFTIRLPLDATARDARPNARTDTRHEER